MGALSFRLLVKKSELKTSINHNFQRPFRVLFHRSPPLKLSKFVKTKGCGDECKKIKKNLDFYCFETSL